MAIPLRVFAGTDFILGVKSGEAAFGFAFPDRLRWQHIASLRACDDKSEASLLFLPVQRDLLGTNFFLCLLVASGNEMDSGLVEVDDKGWMNILVLDCVDHSMEGLLALDLPVVWKLMTCLC